MAQQSVFQPRRVGSVRPVPQSAFPCPPARLPGAWTLHHTINRSVVKPGPTDVPRVWERMEQSEGGSSLLGASDYLSTHPANKRRIAILQKLVPEVRALCCSVASAANHRHFNCERPVTAPSRIMGVSWTLSDLPHAPFGPDLLSSYLSRSETPSMHYYLPIRRGVATTPNLRSQHVSRRTCVKGSLCVPASA
jgi:hypothetical protein